VTRILFELKAAVSNSAPSCTQQSLLLQIGARECILAPGGTRDEIEMKKLDGLLERCGIMKTEVKKAHFKAQDIEQDLSRLVREDMANNLRTQFLPSFPLGRYLLH
jgi:DNA mismatch repair protein MSH2